MECQLIMVHFLWWWPSAIRLILLWSESLSLGLCFFTDQGHAMPVEIETEGGSWISFLSPAEIHPPRINKKPTHTQPISKCLWQFGPKMNREFESPAPFHCITFLSRCDSPPGTNEDYRRYLLLLSLSMSCPAVVSIQRSSCLLLSASPVLKSRARYQTFFNAWLAEHVRQQQQDDDDDGADNNRRPYILHLLCSLLSHWYDSRADRIGTQCIKETGIPWRYTSRYIDGFGTKPPKTRPDSKSLLLSSLPGRKY